MVKRRKQNFDSKNQPLAVFEFDREVRLVDTDATGLAHFGSYIRMMEETEYAFLRSRGLSVVVHDDKGTMGFPRLSADLQIHQPLVFGDQVKVRLGLMSIDGKQVIYRFQIFPNQPSQSESEVAIEGQFIAAFCRFPDKKPPYAILIPEKIIEALTQTQPIAS